MNAEQLHAIGRELGELLNEDDVMTRLHNLESALQNLVNSPQPTHQTAVQRERQELVSALSSSDFDQWATNKRQIAHEIGADGLFGKALAERVETSFRENSATPEVIRQNVQSMLEELTEFAGALESLLSSFDRFEIAFEQLEPGEGEIGILIPRVVTADLWEFTSDLRRIDFELKTFSQLVSGSAETNSIRTISSSDFLVFLAAAPELVSVISNIVTGLRYGYEKLQQLKDVLKKLRELGNSSKETIESMQKDIETAMVTEVSDILAEIQPMYDAAVENGLAKEGFQVSLESTIKGIASRIDKGYSFSFRVGKPTVKDREDPTDEEKRGLEIAQQVASNNEKLQQASLILPGQQVLSLDWQTPDPKDDNG